MNTTQSFCQPLLFLNFLSKFPESWFWKHKRNARLYKLTQTVQHILTWLCSTIIGQQVAPPHRQCSIPVNHRGSCLPRHLLRAFTKGNFLMENQYTGQKLGRMQRRPQGKGGVKEMHHTSTATLKSTIDTLVLRCQQTCTVVFPRWPCRSRDERELLSSSSDSRSTPPSSASSDKHWKDASE